MTLPVLAQLFELLEDTSIPYNPLLEQVKAQLMAQTLDFQLIEPRSSLEFSNEQRYLNMFSQQAFQISETPTMIPSVSSNSN